MKTKAGKAKVAAPVKKAVAKAKAVTKPAPKKSVVKKPITKPVAKPVAKKPAAKKTTAKALVKKSLAKPVTKKPANKKPTAKTATNKPVVKTVVKPAVKKPAVKPAVKKSAAKPMSKKPVAKAKPKSSAKLSPKKPVPVKPPKPQVKVIKTVSPAPSPVVKVMPAAPVATPSSQVPARAGRPSSRLAQLTVPSMAQSVASTAAKASFSQLTLAPILIAPPLTAPKKNPKLANRWKTKPVEELTNDELLSMPDDEYMNAVQFKVFRLKLLTLKQDILSSAGETSEHLREDTVVVPDPADRATIEEEHALELRTRDRERKLLKKIEQSISRIDEGDYGYCDETGEPIGVGRLLARPTATLSLEAQQRRELKQKMFGD